MKRLLLMLALLVTILSACGSPEEPENIVVELGEEASTAFFDFEVKSVSACLGHEGYLAASGYQLVLVELELKNTSSYDLPMGRYDFRLFWDVEEETAVYPLKQFCEEQFLDEYTVPEREKTEGLLVFQVPDDRKNLALGYLEIFEDDHQGDAYIVYFTV